MTNTLADRIARLHASPQGVDAVTTVSESPFIQTSQPADALAIIREMKEIIDFGHTTAAMCAEFMENQQRALWHLVGGNTQPIHVNDRKGRMLYCPCHGIDLDETTEVGARLKGFIELSRLTYGKDNK